MYYIDPVLLKTDAQRGKKSAPAIQEDVYFVAIFSVF